MSFNSKLKTQSSKLLLTGAGGMLAQALVQVFEGRGHTVVGFTRAELDVCDPRSVEAELQAHLPDVVVQCAAFTAVDAAEDRPVEAFAINAEGAFNVARACERVGAAFVYPSTDYVFKGNAKRPYRVDDPVEPINTYGRSKAAGEEAAREAGRHLVVRTSWLYGAGENNFPAKMIELAGKQLAGNAGGTSATGGNGEVIGLRVVDDQIGRPTWTRHLAEAIEELVSAGTTGIVHLTDGGDPVSWCGFAREVLRIEGIDVPVTPVSTAEFPRPAPRPAYSVLDCSETEAILGRRMAEWQAGVAGWARDRKL